MKQSNKSAYKKANKLLSVFLENSDTKNMTDNKKIWKTGKPFLANKISSNCNKITLTQKDEIAKMSLECLIHFL